MTKAVVFDFDGTLTIRGSNVWREIWRRLGYDVGENSYYRELFSSFMNKKITHKQWCDLTCKAFQDKNFNKQILDEIVADIRLTKGVSELFKKLHDDGIQINIVSGNILDIIKLVLKDEKKYINQIKANDFVFDDLGNLKSIVGTKYDYEGKAKYIDKLCKNLKITPNEVCFVGNSLNDEFVYLSGARTICINPHETKTDDSTIWNEIVNVDDLRDLIPIIED